MTGGGVEEEVGGHENLCLEFVGVRKISHNFLGGMKIDSQFLVRENLENLEKSGNFLKNTQKTREIRENFFADADAATHSQYLAIWQIIQ